MVSLAECSFEAAAKPFTAAIDGTDGFSWHLPLAPLAASTTEAYSPGKCVTMWGDFCVCFLPLVSPQTSVIAILHSPCLLT